MYVFIMLLGKQTIIHFVQGVVFKFKILVSGMHSKLRLVN